MLRVLNIRYSLAALIAASALVGCSTPPPPPPPAPPAPPAPPPIALSDKVLQEAAGYQTYMRHDAAMSDDFHSGEDVARSLRMGASYDSVQLLQGAVAYGAVAALQDPTYVASLRKFAMDPDGRNQMARTILNDPNYATAIPGADSAAGLVEAALISVAQPVVDKGAGVKQAAYDIQHQAWSKEFVQNRDERLLAAKSSSADAMLASSDDVHRLNEAATGASPLAITGAPARAPYPPVVVHALAVAALAALGQAGDDNAPLIISMLGDATSQKCLDMAKLNLYQCLAVAKPHYEDVFCLGQHALADTGQCMLYAAGVPEPVTTPIAVSRTEVAYGAKAAPAHSKKKKKSDGA
jgi:hypothetical protein